MKYASPYTPGAGTMPPYLAGRAKLLDTSNKNLESALKGYPQKSIIYYGLPWTSCTNILKLLKRKVLFDK